MMMAMMMITPAAPAMYGAYFFHHGVVLSPSVISVRTRFLNKKKVRPRQRASHELSFLRSAARRAPAPQGAAWLARALPPAAARDLRAARAAGLARPLRGKDEWQFVYAMGRVQRRQKRRLPSHLRATAERLLDQVSDVRAPLPLAWALGRLGEPGGASAPSAGGQAQSEALRRLLLPPPAPVRAGGVLRVPPWAEDVPARAPSAQAPPAMQVTRGRRTCPRRRRPAAPAPAPAAPPAPAVQAAPVQAAPVQAACAGGASPWAPRANPWRRARCRPH